MSAKSTRITPHMAETLRFLSRVDSGHRGDSSANTWRALNARGFIECVEDGMCSDTGKDVWLYRITDDGKAALAWYDEHDQRSAGYTLQVED